ncbi:AMP-binding protein [Burkholderia ubonensis]|uniref:AMP-binding protein n=1 Tax=Burkholderia ubonensis TaxID=101571 RepID=UPI001E567CB6|nr:AMP-binding protein [Burkholderia ubonensis]
METTTGTSMVKNAEHANSQYTSGSTGTPKGVMISHANILSNMAVIAEASNADASTVFVSWLPVFHDMGFFGKVLLPIQHETRAQDLVTWAPAATARPPRQAACVPSCPAWSMFLF